MPHRTFVGASCFALVGLTLSALVLAQAPNPTAMFTEGSTKAEVLKAEGTPQSVNKYPALGFEEWGYNHPFDSVKFDIATGKVTEWSNRSGKLHATMEAIATTGAAAPPKLQVRVETLEAMVRKLDARLRAIEAAQGRNRIGN